MDKILLEGVRLPARVGVTEEERNSPQLLIVDVQVGVRMEKAGLSGNLADTLNYAELFRRIEKLLAERAFTLLEEIGQGICRLALQMEGSRDVRVRIRKVQPFSDKVQSVGVEMRQRRKKSEGMKGEV